MAQSPIKKINRFTTLPVLLDMLQRKKLVLLDPESWDDRNDSRIIEEYKRRKKIQGLFALCCAWGDETIHHWRTFADGIGGCCIEFSYEGLAARLDQVEGVRYGPVTYRKIQGLEQVLAVDDMPFTKRWPYRCEEEFRIIWEGRSADKFYEIPFDLSIINLITISQGMPGQVYSTIREHLRGAFTKPDQRINRSTLYENETWIGKFRSI